MKARILFVGLFALLCLVMTGGNGLAQETLYEEYANASEAELNREIKQMSEKIARSFDPDDIEQKRRELLCSETLRAYCH